MKNADWLNEKLSNFKEHIKSNLSPKEEWTPEIHKNVEYVMDMSLDDWLQFSSKHLMRFRANPCEATDEICSLYGLETADSEVKYKITRYVELFIEVLS